MMWFGWLCLGLAVYLAVILRKDTKRRNRVMPCPFCAEEIKPAAKFCRHCRNDISHLEAPTEPIATSADVSPEATRSATVAEWMWLIILVSLTVLNIRH